MNSAPSPNVAVSHKRTPSRALVRSNRFAFSIVKLLVSSKAVLSQRICGKSTPTQSPLNPLRTIMALVNAANIMTIPAIPTQAPSL
jgi:hypothetical protein